MEPGRPRVRLFEDLGVGHGGPHSIHTFPADFVFSDGDPLEVSELAERIQRGVGDFGESAQFEESELFHSLQDAGLDSGVVYGEVVSDAQVFEGVQGGQWGEGGVGKVVEHEVEFFEV